MGSIPIRSTKRCVRIFYRDSDVISYYFDLGIETPYFFADLTQLGECFPYKEEVGSSNLSIGTAYTKAHFVMTT